MPRTFVLSFFLSCFPFKIHFSSAFSKGHLYSSYCPKAEPGQNVILAPHSHLGSMVLQPQLLWSLYIITAFLQLPFTDLQETVSTTSAPGLNFISSYDTLPSPLAQLFNSSRDTLVITHLVFQDIKFWNPPLSLQYLPPHTTNVIPLWNLLLCPCHGSWFLTSVLSSGMRNPTASLASLPSERSHGQPLILSLLYFPIQDTFRNLFSSLLFHGYILLKDVWWCVNCRTINVCSLISARFSALLSNTFVSLLIYFLLTSLLPIIYLKLTSVSLLAGDLYTPFIEKIQAI